MKCSEAYYYDSLSPKPETEHVNKAKSFKLYSQGKNDKQFKEKHPKLKILGSHETLEIAYRCSHVKLNRKGVEFRETQKRKSEIRYQFLTELEKSLPIRVRRDKSELWISAPVKTISQSN